MPRCPWCYAWCVLLALGHFSSARAQTPAPEPPTVLPALPAPAPLPDAAPPLDGAVLVPDDVAPFPRVTPFTPNMFGSVAGGATVNTLVTLPNGTTGTARVPLVSRGPFEISENESPRPTDRAFLTYNFFSDLNSRFRGATGPFDLHRETIGLEKTFCDESASVGFRLPFLQVTGDSLVKEGLIGDLSLIAKWAFYYDKARGDVISTGLVLTLPTGNDQLNRLGNNFNDVIVQPYIGYLWNLDRWFIQGFSSLAVPTATGDVTILNTDIGVGYWLYKNDANERFARIGAIVPTLECHLLTPLNHRGSGNMPVGMPDSYTVTTGVQIIFPDRSTLGFAVGAPLSGASPYDVQAIVSFNYHF
jgi:hypothetical protein